MWVGIITARYDGSNLAPTVTLAYLFSNRPWQDKWRSKSGEVKEHGVLKSKAVFFSGGFFSGVFIPPPPYILIFLSHSHAFSSPPPSILTPHAPFLHCASYRCAEGDNPQHHVNYTLFFPQQRRHLSQTSLKSISQGYRNALKLEG